MKTFKNLLKTGLLGSALVAGSAMAAVPAAVTTALSDAQTDGVTVAGVVLGVIIAIAAFKFIRKAL